MKKLITNKQWQFIYEHFMNSAVVDETGYTEAIGFSFSFNPVTDHVMSMQLCLFDPVKAAAMYFWYKGADSKDKSILKYFDEYKHCIDKDHDYFNSNYGLYAYEDAGLKFCIEELIENHKSRRACFCINNNRTALYDCEIDKLCTNTIHFFIRDVRLEMVVQMRSSNFTTLLPYDAFMFSVFYYQVYKALQKEYKLLRTGLIHMQIASLHHYPFNKERYNGNIVRPSRLIDFYEPIESLEKQLQTYLDNYENFESKGR